jgi:Ca2+-binding RTX toxin-like protein
MKGGSDDDYYFVDGGDAVQELDGEGLDTIQAYFEYYLPIHVENLILTGGGNINGNGNALANQITGTTGNNGIRGFGGADVLIGNGGNDTFVLAKNETAGDVIADFIGNAAAAGDSLLLVGWGAGAFLTPVNDGLGTWTVNSGLGSENFRLLGNPPLTVSDYSFV